MTCPKCKRSCFVEEHGTKPGECHWWLCRACGAVWDDKPKEEDNG